MADPREILADALRRATSNLPSPIIADSSIAKRIQYIAKSSNRAGVRLLMACTLAKIARPEVDIRKPFRELGSADSYSGRKYDEEYITTFINEQKLPANSTTAFLTPAFRAKNVALMPGLNLGGTPAQLYQDAILLLNDVQEKTISAEDLLAEVIRNLIEIKEANRQRLASLLSALRDTQEESALPLSAEAIVTLVEQHIASPNASRLPVLIIAAAYQSAQAKLQERVLTLQSHNAADEQTGALGDVEIALENEDAVVTVYEMKLKRVTIADIDRALQKIAGHEGRIDNYIFITTDIIEDLVRIYASEQYVRTGGTEIVVLDCIGFLRHFLHLFHRLRADFLEAYQTLVLDEPASAVRQELKETLLTLRRAAETGDT